MPKITIKPPNLTEYQKAIVYSDARFTVTLASTKSGKTFSHIWWLFEQAHQKTYPKGANFWWVAPVYNQAKIAFDRMRRKVARFGSLYKVNLSELSITTPIGTIIRFKTADKPDNLYGEDVYAAVFDEFTRAKIEAWYAIRSTLTATRGKCKLIGNFKGLANWGFRLVQQVKKSIERGLPTEFEIHKITAWDAVEAGVLSKDEVEQAQRQLPPSMFAELYLAEPTDSPDQLISNAAIGDFFTNDFVEMGRAHYLTADIAFYGSDKFVVGVWYGWMLVKVVVMNKSSSQEVEDTILKLRQEHQIPYSHIVYDADGIGSFLTGRLESAIAFRNDAAAFPPVEGEPKEGYANLKSQCYFRLAKKMNAKELYCTADFGDEHEEAMVQDLQAVRNYTHGKDGKLAVLPKAKVKELIGRSPDFSDMLMMRMYFDLVEEIEYPVW